MSVSDFPALPPVRQKLGLGLWIAAMATVAVFSLMPGLGPPQEFGIDKIFHSLGYMTLALLAQAGFSTRRVALAAALCMVPYGIAIEIAQGYVPNRYTDMWDAVANSVGALAGIAVMLPFRRLLARLP